MFVRQEGSCLTGSMQDSLRYKSFDLIPCSFFCHAHGSSMCYFYSCLCRKDGLGCHENAAQSLSSVKPHILAPKGAAQHTSCCCSGKSPVVVMLIRIFRHERGGYARKHQLLGELSSPWLSQRWGLRDSLPQGTMLHGWQCCATLSWGNNDLLNQIPAGPAMCFCIHLIKLLEDLSESIWACYTNWARANSHLVQENKFKNM